MKCYLIRHGMTQDNIDLNFSGCRTDTPLLKQGIDMLDEVKDVPENSILYVSPMLRARQTAEIMFPDMEQIIIDDLREMDFGIFEAKNHKMLDGDPDYQAWLDSDGMMKIPGGESVGIFRERIRNYEKGTSFCSERGDDGRTLDSGICWRMAGEQPRVVVSE